MSKGRTALPDPEEPQPQVLRFDIPESGAPGFLRRQRDALRYRDALRTNPSVATMDEMIGFLVGFVTEPTDRDQARELVLDLSRDDYNGLLRAVNQEDPDFLPSSPPRSSANSVSG